MKYTILTKLFFLLYTPALLAQMQPFKLQEVQLTPGIFKNAQQVDLAYILKLDPDKLLAPYLVDAGLPLKAPRYGNWESSGLDGHIAGHYLSALAMMHAGTANTAVKERLDYMVAELGRCQDKNGNGYVGGIPNGKLFWKRLHEGDIDGSTFGLNNTWVPLYNLHKVFAGLHDAYTIANNQQAKTILIKLGNWFIALIEPLSEQQIQQILATEHGGINESFADLYSITKDPKYLVTAEQLSHRNILNPLLKKQDSLTGLHANTQIPKVIGFEKIGQLKQNTDWQEAATYFWENVVQTRTVAFGGNSVREHFNPVDDFSSMLTSNQGPETCNSYNMLKLSKALFLDRNDERYLAFYERTLYNHILSTQHPEKGGFVYFTPIRPNHYRVYSQPETSMWCCVGSGIENHAKYNELIYSHKGTDLYINLFMASQLRWNDKGITLSQTTSFPDENTTELVLQLNQSSRFKIHLRHPQWTEAMQISINGKAQNIKSAEGPYIVLDRKWRNGDRIAVKFNLKTQLEYLPDGSNWAAIVRGPIVLAAKTSTEDLAGQFADDSRMGHETKGKLFPIHQSHVITAADQDYLHDLKQIDNMTFALDSLKLQPFFKIHESRYQLYFQTLSEQEYALQKQAQEKADQQLLALESKIVDRINCGEQQPEADHHYRGEKSRSGYDDGKFWRSTTYYISYKLQNKDLSGTQIVITTLGPARYDAIEVFVDGVAVKPTSVNGNTITLNAPAKENFDLRIKAKDGMASAKFYQITVLK